MARLVGSFLTVSLLTVGFVAIYAFSEARSALRHAVVERLQATAAEGKTLDDIEPIINKELDRIRREPPTAAEVERALAKFEKAEYARLTPPLGRAVTLVVGFAQHDDPAYYRRDFGRYFRVKAADIHRVARRYLAPERVRLAILPLKKGQQKSEAIQSGPLGDGNHTILGSDRVGIGVYGLQDFGSYWVVGGLDLDHL